MIIKDIKLNLDVSDLLSKQRTGASFRAQPHMGAIMSELLRDVREDHLLEPSAAFEIFSIEEVRKDGISLYGGHVIFSRAFSMHIGSAEELAVSVCTIGTGLENRAAELFKNNQRLHGLLLDSIGSYAVENLCEEICRFIGEQASSRGSQIGNQLRPGMPGFSLLEQINLFGLVYAQDIGVSLTSAQVMSPVKSASLIVGIGHQMARFSKSETCALCNLNKTCRFKTQPASIR